ncbi:uncharacterized protein BDW47DRAFT_99205 [Aspergillus candidus]|uniref:Uncharacterized protein n=1 Tax=Aspergillus candidus TaxID=41067 RepID=A0A2I2FLL7_ASPCN|nr:hypothetical protein BDW47DRAFT_99205 [Aspergillus candidus]PLB41513.1 hypothetical protein BDW47DRAFT_99205 [Aspergillus candidus]
MKGREKKGRSEQALKRVPSPAWMMSYLNYTLIPREYWDYHPFSRSTSRYYLSHTQYITASLSSPLLLFFSSSSSLLSLCLLLLSLSVVFLSLYFLQSFLSFYLSLRVSLFSLLLLYSTSLITQIASRLHSVSSDL